MITKKKEGCKENPKTFRTLVPLYPEKKIAAYRKNSTRLCKIKTSDRINTMTENIVISMMITSSVPNL